MPSATIKLFLIHGDPKRLRTAEILISWTGKAASAPRSEFDELLKREEAGNSGVYFLTGTDPESGKDAVYIGEAKILRERLKIHLDRDFWNAATFVTSKDENLTKAHIQYLEGRLIEQAKAAGRAIVLNGQSSGSPLPESDREDMEVFLDRIHQLMPVLGQDFLVPITQPARSNRNRHFITTIKGLTAHGVRGANGFVVLKGSQVVLMERDSAQSYTRDLRRRLIAEGVLIAKDGFYEFVRDQEFTSPSAAAAVVHGGDMNGLTTWKSSDGKTLKEIEAVV